MPDAFEECDDERQSQGALARISDVVGVPAAAFFGSDANMSEHLQRKQEEQVLGMVWAYLREVDREAARRFVIAVEALVETEVK